MFTEIQVSPNTKWDYVLAMPTSSGAVKMRVDGIITNSTYAARKPFQVMLTMTPQVGVSSSLERHINNQIQREEIPPTTTRLEVAESRLDPGLWLQFCLLSQPRLQVSFLTLKLEVPNHRLLTSPGVADGSVSYSCLP